MKYASNSGGSWSNYPIDTTASIVGRYTSLDIDSNDNVHISYGDLNAWNLKYATNIAGSWSRSVIDDGGGDGQAGMYSSLEIDSNDLIHVSYWGRNSDLKYAAKSASGGTWISVYNDSLFGVHPFMVCSISVAMRSMFDHKSGKVRLEP